MVVYISGPVNIEQGNTVNFTVEFLDSTGAITVPSSANINVTYTNTSNNQTTDTVALSESNSFFTGSWATTTAALGLATWTAIDADGETQSTGQIRIIQRQSTL